MTGAPAPAPVVCEVRGAARLLVAEPFFEYGRPLTLGRVRSGGRRRGRPGGGRAVTGPGRGAVTERLGRAGRRVAQCCTASRSRRARPGPGRTPSTTRSPRLAGRARPRAAAPTCATVLASRSTRRTPATSTTRSARAEDGGLRLFVHIADVAALVPEGRRIDSEAASAGDLGVPAGPVEPMLPERLSADLCSLRPDATGGR